ncbi:hypothetical protein [Aeromonas salmonicida]
MMVDLKVMAYFKLSLSTHNWDRAFFIAHNEKTAQQGRIEGKNR